VSSSQLGYLASIVTEMTGCGGITTPWIISVSPGQVIKLTLFDFGVMRAKRGPLGSSGGIGVGGEGGGGGGTGLLRPPVIQCQTYAVLKETTSGGTVPVVGGSSTLVHHLKKNITVCGGIHRQSVVHLTGTNRLEVGLVRNDHLIYGPHYMFQYQGKSH